MSQDSPVLPLTRASVQEAHERIKPYIHRTPLLTSRSLSALASTPNIGSILLPSLSSSTESTYNGTSSSPSNGTVAPSSPTFRLYFKPENLQKIGAFKARGAFHALSRLSPSERKRGVITHSSGNHAQALAYAARTFNIKATIIMPEISMKTKIEATRGYGATVVFSGSTSTERESVVKEVQDREGQILVPPYDCVDVMLGQGTVGLEVEGQFGEMWEGGGKVPYELSKEEKEGGRKLNAVITPCGGGGLLSGTATSLFGTGVHVFGAEPSFQGADDCHRGLASSPPERITTVKSLTVCDGLRTPVGVLPWSVISDKKKVRGVFSVTEEMVVVTWKLVLERLKMVVEPSAVVGLAVVLFDEEFRRIVEREGGEEGWDVALVLSGGNTSVEAFAKWFGDTSK